PAPQRPRGAGSGRLQLCHGRQSARTDGRRSLLSAAVVRRRPAVVSGALLLQASAAAAILGLELGVLTRAALPIGLPGLSGREKVHGGRVLGRRGPARKRGRLWATLERWPGLARSEGARTRKDKGGRRRAL